jgi:hypothetical protein
LIIAATTPEKIFKKGEIEGRAKGFESGIGNY